MPRANRYFLPNYVWHITHRCHKKTFLLKYSIDRNNWVHWLFEAKKRHGLEVLNYMVTSNHIHLLVYGGMDREVIPRSMQLIAGRTAQRYNQRKRRNGAFWEDRYHATAVETQTHLTRCMLYIDLNMVRAGIMSHPGEWRHCGYHELMVCPKRYRIISRNRLGELLGVGENFHDRYAAWLQEALTRGSGREAFWSESIAAGSRTFVDGLKQQLRSKGSRRRLCYLEDMDLHILRDLVESYDCVSGPEKVDLRPENNLLWDIYPDI
jgi:REP element-mobilizing transposase RayT